MRSFVVELKNEGYKVQGGKLACTLMTEAYDWEEPKWKRPALVVVPGGGYGFVSIREGEPIATSFLAKGYQVFVLTYLISPDGVRYPEQLLELASAVDYVKKHAEEFRVNPDEVFVLGFSAGGHLAGNLSVEWQNMGEHTDMALDCKPRAVGLSYPVITCKGPTHFGSYDNLLQGYSEEEKAVLLDKLCLNERVTEQTPPTFIWTTANDNDVPARNSLLHALALADNGVPYELHVYPVGAHGGSTCDFEINPPNPYLRKNSVWMKDCADFFRSFCQEAF